MNESKVRIESVDAAKGIGILLVVFAHVIATHNVGWKVEEVITSFHMPLFFVLSGLFFSRKSSFKDFLINKTNRLLVPFFFYYLVFSVGIASFFYLLKGNLMEKLPDILLGFYNENLNIVGAIWFLMSLWFVSLLYYFSTSIKNEWGG